MGTQWESIKYICYSQWHVPGQSTMFIPLMSHNFARSARKREANGLAYSRCPANTNNLVMPLVIALVVKTSELVVWHSCKGSAKVIIQCNSVVAVIVRLQWWGATSISYHGNQLLDLATCTSHTHQKPATVKLIWCNVQFVANGYYCYEPCPLCQWHAVKVWLSLIWN